MHKTNDALHTLIFKNKKYQKWKHESCQHKLIFQKKNHHVKNRDKNLFTRITFEKNTISWTRGQIALYKVNKLISKISRQIKHDQTRSILYTLHQGFPNWGTCTPRGTFARFRGYIWSEGNNYLHNTWCCNLHSDCTFLIFFVLISTTFIEISWV